MGGEFMGLSAKELTQIKDTLATGKKPRVVFTESAGQIAGQIGHVVQLDDPEVQEDWILVRFGSDVLPFPPSDLSVAPRGAVAKKILPDEVAAPEPPELKVVREKVPASRPEPRPEPRPETKPSAPVTSAPISQVSQVSQEKTVSEADSPATPAPRKPVGAAKAKGPKPLPSFTVTLSYTEGEWTVGAVQGAKTLAKPYLIKPSEALKMVSMLDVPGVHEAVEHILSGERAQAKAHAEKLRAELAELEAKLAELGA
jgi:hypothetical protein